MKRETLLRFFTCFIAVLVFSSPLVTIAQLHSGRFTEEAAAAQSAAEADANTDVNKPLYFGLGCLMTAIPVISSLVVEGSFTPAAVIGAPAGVFGTYLYQPEPPMSRLVGKSPEYIDAYIVSYKSKRGKTQALWTSAGCLTGGCVTGALISGVLVGVLAVTDTSN